MQDRHERHGSLLAPRKSFDILVLYKLDYYYYYYDGVSLSASCHENLENFMQNIVPEFI